MELSGLLQALYVPFHVVVLPLPTFIYDILHDTC